MVETLHLRHKVAECVRLLEWMGLIDYSGHCSVRIPNTDHVLINAAAVSRCRLTPEHIVTVNLDGQLVAGDLQPPVETALHTEIYRARPDVWAVAHLHTLYSTLLTLAGQPIQPVIFHGGIFVAGVPVYNDSRHINSRERGAALAATLGQARAVMMRGHGAVVVGDEPESLLLAATYLEDNCEKQYRALQVGQVTPLTPAEAEEGNATLWSPWRFKKLWSYYTDKAGLDLTDTPR